MKYIFTIIVIFGLGVFSSLNTYAAEPVNWKDIIVNNTGDDCGVLPSTDNSSGVIINPNDASICTEDISTNVIYFIFGKVIEEISYFSEIINVSDNVKEMSLGLGVGDPIIAVLSTVATLVVMVGILIVLITTIISMMKSTNGSFMGEKWNPAKVITRVGGSLVLMIPMISGLSLIQISVIVVAISANITGNFVWANFLNLVQVKATQIESPKSSIESLSLSQSSTMVLGEVCLNRTNQKILEDKWLVVGNDYDDDSIFNDDNWLGIIGYGKKDLTVNETFDRYNSCMTPANIYRIEDKGGLFNYDDNRNKYINLYSRGNIEKCKEDTYAYDEDSYGSQYSCSYIKYKYTSLEDSLKSPNSDDSEGQDVILNSVQDFRSSFANYDEYNDVKGLESKIREIINSGKNISFQSEELENLYSPIVEKLKDKIRTSIENNISNNIDISKDLDLKYKTVFIYHQYVFNNLMGAYYNEDNNNDVQIQTNREELGKPTSFAEQMIQDFAKPAAKLLESSHCAKYWAETKKSRETIRKLNESMDSKSNSFSNISMECIGVMSPSSVNEEGNTFHDQNNYTLYFKTLQNEFINADENPSFSENKAFKDKAVAYHKTKISPQAENEAKVKQYTLALWFFVAREAVLNSISEMNKESVDELLPEQIRKQGWGGSGGYMLQISANQQNANKMFNQILENIEWGGEIPFGESDYVNKKAFKQSNEDQSDADYKYESSFEKMNWDLFLSKANKKFINQSGITEVLENEEDNIDFIEMFEDLILFPMDYLEKASGIDNTDRSLRDAIKECSAAGNCKISDVHPLNALMQFGHELVTVSTTLLITEVIVASIGNIGEESSDDGYIGNKIKGLVSKAGWIAVVIKLAKFISVILDFLHPLTTSMLFIGILFAYIVPTIPYVAFLIVFINWIVLIIELMVSLPIWLSFYALTRDDGESKTDIKMLWNFYGQLYFKPAFVVIALIVGWTLSSITLYILNMTLFSSGIGQASESASITSIIDIIMFYIIYIIIVFVALRQSFSVITTLPDTFFERINIKSTGDSSIVQEMNIEKVLQTAAITNVIENLSETAKDKVKGLSDQQKMLEENEKLKSTVMELQQRLKDK